MIHPQTVLQVLYFFLPAYLANMSPVLVRRRFGALAFPIDRGQTFRGKRLLGDHKTWRGLVSSVVVGMLVFELQRLLYQTGFARELALIDYAAFPLLSGLLMGLGSGVGDLVKSFFKRRIDIEPGASWPVFDQLDFVFGAYMFVLPVYAPPLSVMLASLPIIFVGNLATAAAGCWLGFKETWI